MKEIEELEANVTKFKQNMNDINGIRSELVTITNEMKKYNKNITDIEALLKQDIQALNDLIIEQTNTAQKDIIKNINSLKESINKHLEEKNDELIKRNNILMVLTVTMFIVLIVMLFI